MTDSVELTPLAKSLLDNKFVGILVVENEKVKYANEKAESLFSLSAAELADMDFEEIVEFDKTDNSLKNLVDIGQKVIVRGFVVSPDANEKYPVDFSVSALPANGNCYSIFVASTRDRESFIFLKRQFYKRISHELRSPLSSIVGALALLKSGKLSKIESIVQIAERNSKRLTLMINSLLDVEQYESGKIFLQKRRSNLKQVVDDALSLINEYAEESDVEIVATAKAIPVDADEERLPQAIAQLLKYFTGHRQGLARIDIETSDQDGWADLKFTFVMDAQQDMTSSQNEEFVIIPTLSLDIAMQVVELHNGTLSGHDKTSDHVLLRLPLGN